MGVTEMHTEKMNGHDAPKSNGLNKPSSRVAQMLTECAGTYDQRNALYGDNYKRFGIIMLGLFPKGLTLRSPDDWNRIGLFVQAMSKVTRYAQNFEKGGHDDSLLDSSVYQQMLREVDEEARALDAFLQKDQS